MEMLVSSLLLYCRCLLFLIRYYIWLGEFDKCSAGLGVMLCDGDAGGVGVGVILECSA